MTERKTQENSASVSDFLNSVNNEKRRKDSVLVRNMMESISGRKAKMWGPSIVGFDKHHYKYKNGSDAEICKIGFSPRAQSLVFYLGNFKDKDKLLTDLGKHKTSVGGCLYINKLEDVDLEVLEDIVERAYRHEKA